MVPKFLEFLVVLCFERRFPQKSTVARLKSKNLATQNFGLATSIIDIIQNLM